jgi:kinesin family protein 1
MQFKFVHQGDIAFSTESLQNTTGDLPFYHAQQFQVTVTGNFLEYCRNEPITFELFGHFDSHPLHDQLEADSRPSSPTSSLSNRRSSEGPSRSLSVSGDEPTHDVLAWYELCELAPSGLYAPVDVVDDKSVRVFQLQQGVQRKVRVTISHESGDDIEWTRVMEMSIGNVRTTYEAPASGGTPAVQLAVSPSQTTASTGDDRVFLAFEAAWDSAKHESIQLNRVTPSSELVFCTLTFVVGVKGCTRPAMIQQTLGMRIVARDGGKRRNFFGSLLGPTIRDVSKVSTFYEMRMHEVSDEASVAAAYDVEKRLRGWRPRSNSLLKEHTKRCRRFNKVVEVELTRQALELAKAKSASFRTETPKVDFDPEALTRKVVALLTAPNLTDAMLDADRQASPTKQTAVEKKKIELYPELTPIDPLSGIGCVFINQMLPSSLSLSSTCCMFASPFPSCIACLSSGLASSSVYANPLTLRHHSAGFGATYCFLRRGILAGSSGGLLSPATFSSSPTTRRIR